MANQGLLNRLSERMERRKKAHSLSVTTTGTLKSDHIGPHYNRVKVGWENQINWSSYWAKVQQPVCTWSLKTAY